MEEALISVLIPVYGVEKELGRCLESVCGQTYRNLQIVLVNDCSPDGSAAICDEWAQKDPRIELVHHAVNRGLSAARNTGLEHARGEYVIFTDSDDYVEPDYVETLYRTVTEHGADIASCGYLNLFPSGKQVDETFPEVLEMDSHEALRRMCYNDRFYVTCWDKIYRRSLFEDVLFPEGRLFEDTATTYMVVDKAEKIVADCREPKYYYVIKAGSITSSGYNPKKMDYVYMSDQMANYVESHYPDLRAAALRKRALAYFSTLCQLVNSHAREPEVQKQLTGFLMEHKKELMSDPCCPKRDRAGYLALSLGYPFFAFMWQLYCRIRKGSASI